MIEAKIGASRENGMLPCAIASLIFLSLAPSVLLSLSSDIAPADLRFCAERRTDPPTGHALQADSEQHQGVIRRGRPRP